MKLYNWIVLTSEGATYSPNGREVYNLQVLGKSIAKTEENAINNVFNENPSLERIFGFNKDACIAIKF